SSSTGYWLGGFFSKFSHHVRQYFCKSNPASRSNVSPVTVSPTSREIRNTRISRLTRAIKYHVSTLSTSAYGSTRHVFSSPVLRRYEISRHSLRQIEVRSWSRYGEVCSERNQGFVSKSSRPRACCARN